MGKVTKVAETTTQVQSEDFLLEQRKVKALEKIANSLDALTVWFEEIEKQDWSDRMQFYLYEMHNNQKSIAESLSSIADGDTKSLQAGSRPKKDSEK